MPVGYVDGFSKNELYSDTFNQCMDKGMEAIDYLRKLEEYGVKQCFYGHLQRPYPQAGHRGNGGKRGLQPGGGGSLGLCSEKNLGLMKKTLEIFNLL